MDSQSIIRNAVGPVVDLSVPARLLRRLLNRRSPSPGSNSRGGPGGPDESDRVPCIMKTRRRRLSPAPAASLAISKDCSQIAVSRSDKGNAGARISL